VQQATLYFRCEKERVPGGSDRNLYLYENVQLEIGKGRPFQVSDQLSTDADPSQPQYPVRGTADMYQCSPGSSNNWSVQKGTTLTGVCYKTSFSDWRCDVGYEYDYRKVTRGVNGPGATAPPVAAAAPVPRAQASSKTYTDPKTGLQWLAQDNGVGVNWQQAMNYCQAQTTDGYKDWSLPTIDQLQQAFKDGVQNHVKLTGCDPYAQCVWSSSKNGAREAWAFALGDVPNHQASVNVGDTDTGALCVRRPAAKER